MPNDVVKSFADKTGKSVDEMEKLWNKAKAKAKEEYPDIKADSDEFYKRTMGIFKKMAGVKEGRETKTFFDLIKEEMDHVVSLGDDGHDMDSGLDMDEADESPAEEADEPASIYYIYKDAQPVSASFATADAAAQEALAQGYDAADYYIVEYEPVEGEIISTIDIGDVTT